MSKKLEETIIIRQNQMVYAVRLISKTENNCDNGSAPYLIVEDGKIKFIDRIYDSKREFNFTDEVHVLAKEAFIAKLKTAIKEQVLQLKQLELILSEMNLRECIGDSVSESASFLQRVKGFIAGT